MSQSLERHLRIAYVIGQLGHGGAERQLYECVSHLDPEQFDSMVYSLTPEIHPYGDLLLDRGVPVVGLKRRGRGDLARVVELGRLLRKQQPDLVHSFLAMDGITATLACKWFVPTSLRLLSARCVSVKRDWLREVAIGRSYRSAALVVCNAQQVARFLVSSYRVDPARIRVVYNGVRAHEFALPRRIAREGRGRLGDKSPVVGIVCRLEPAKNVSLFIRAAAILANDYPDLGFMVAGDGSSRAELEKLSRERGLEGRIRFVGMRDDVPALLARFDLLLHTSNHEGFSNSVLEAMAAGLPVVATEVGGLQELISDGETGLLVPAGDLEALVAAAKRLLGDWQLAEEMGRKAAEHVRHRFTVHSMVQDMVRVYQEGLGLRQEAVEPAARAVGGQVSL